MKSVYELYEDVQELIENDRKNDAIKSLEKLVELHPDFAPALNDLGALYISVGDCDKAECHCKRATELDPENVIFQKNLASFYCNQSDELEKAIEIYTVILQKNPTDLEILNILGHICLLLERSNDARVFFKKMLEIEPWNEDAREGLGQIGKGQGNGRCLT